ncbi:MAG TPA: hypothetical protein VMR54_12540 [Thermoanaerobaculia bacterium]|nr:hypothetical protein [Thermoanaerobaculia bacterium]
MKRNLFWFVAGALALGALAGACAHASSSASPGGVRVVSDAQDATGCEKLSEVRLTGTWTSAGAREELENLVRSKGGNVLLLSGGKATPDSGVAYRCAGGTSAGN